MSLIGFCGKKRSGKDTGAEILIKEHNFIKYAFADALKQACQAIFLLTDQQVDGSKKEDLDPRWNVSPRKMFQIFGTEIFRNNLDKFFPEMKEYKDEFWIYRFKLWHDKIRKEKPNTNIVITDIRFPNEMKIVKELGGKIIKVHRPNYKNGNDNHASEKHVDNMKGDFEVYNNENISKYQQKILKIYKKMENN